MLHPYAKDKSNLGKAIDSMLSIIDNGATHEANIQHVQSIHKMLDHMDNITIQRDNTDGTRG